MNVDTKRGGLKVHIVYIARYRGKVMYVGEGLPDRYTHLTSGTSHIYAANKHHFEGKSLQIDVVEEGLTKVESTEREAELIVKLSPEWNKAVPRDSCNCISKGDRLKLFRYFNRRFSQLKLLGCVGHELLKLLVNKADSSGYVELTGKQVRELSGGKVGNKYPSYLLETAQYRQYTYMDEFVKVRKRCGRTHVRCYQLTEEVMRIVK